MNKLDNLPEITDRALDGLRADENLKTRILNAALQNQEPRTVVRSRQLVPALLSAVAVMILCVFLLNGKKPLLQDHEQNLIHSFSAGNSASASVSFGSFTGTDPLSFASVELLSAGRISDPDLLNQLTDLIKNHSESVPNGEMDMKDQLNFYGSGGLLFSLPVEAPFIDWSDGPRKCEPFFDLFNQSVD